jgi:RNA exonuclease 4
MCKPQNDIQIDTSAYIEVSKYDEEHSLTNKNDTVQYSKKLVKKPANNEHNNAQKKKKNDDHHTKKAKKIKKNALKEKNRRITQRKQLLAKMEAEQEISLKEQGKYLALDCEMVGVGEGGFKSALARVSIVDYNNAIVFDTYVKVSEPVTDYRTFVSGVRPEHIESDLAMDFK